MSMKSFLESSPSTPVHGPLVRSPVRILGSGLSALTLARSLHKKKIPFKIFTKDCPPEDSPNRHDYSLSLPARSIRSLKLLLNMSTKSFQDHLLVPNTTPFPRGTTNTIVRVHRGRLERCLRSLFKDDIEWNCEIKVRSSGPPRLVFPPHVDALEGNITFDCMGVHSPVQCPGSYNVISPIVVFRGTVILSKTLWDQKFQDWFPRNTAHINKKFGATNLDLIINQISEQTGEVSLTYIYSRPVLDGLMDTEDELWKPTRPTHEAASPVLIEKFLDEIKTFRHKNVLPGPYNVIFNPEKMKEDRILHWLMRTLRADQPEAIKLWASDEKIMKLGDAVMSMPIVETIGAELAISDGLKAAEQIEKFGGERLHCWFIERWQWKLAVSHESYRRVLSCCMQDSGYCGLGDVCASIEGYCCHKDENEQICMLRLGISFPDDITSDPDFNSDIDSEDLDSSLTSISSISSSSSTSQSQSESESQSITHIKSDDESTDSDLGTESSDSDGASSPPMSMLMNALNSGPLADEDADADTDEDEDENADPDSALDSGSEGEGDVDTGTNVNPEPTTVVLSLGTAVASAVPFDVMNKGGVSSLGAGESSTLVSSLEGLETSSATAGSNANELTSSALPSQSISEGGLNASATTSAVDGTFTGGAVRIRRESGLEGWVARSCLFLGVSFVVWVVL
ncbi:hypothetical protein ABEW05_004225 [Botrytis cinerea]